MNRADLVARMAELAACSVAAWDGAIDGARIDEEQNGAVDKVAVCELARDESGTHWESAMAYVEAGESLTLAIAELEGAARIDREWGDDSAARRAIEAVRGAIVGGDQ